MSEVNPEAFAFALSKIEDGFIFEKFAQEFVGEVMGYSFVPVGGLKDRGIDGLEHMCQRDGHERNIYQMSIEKACESKLEGTIIKLKRNKVAFSQLYFVTNQIFPNIDIFIDSMYEKHNKTVRIFDIAWLSSKVNHSARTSGLYQSFISSYLHEFNQPGKSYAVSDLVSDPRLFVFLRQQWEGNRRNQSLDEILADTLILYCLEGTDPDKGIFKGAAEIKRDMAQYIKFDAQLLYPVVDKRLKDLSKKPRRINHHSNLSAYCLQYETRIEIQNRNIADEKLHETFRAGVERKLRDNLKDANLRVKDCFALIESVLHQLFYSQGLEFSNFVLHGENQQAFEKDLPDIISSVVDYSSVVIRNKEEVKTAVLLTIRSMVYAGSAEEMEFMRRLSSTYMMMFLLQCDPKVATYFNSMASKLSVYVCTSILIPALSEYYLDRANRRHWNLLKGAHDAGVTLIVNDTIIDELCAHFRMINNRYKTLYKQNESFYLDDEVQTLYIDEIMIRAYVYSKNKGQVTSFDDFLDNFVGLDESGYRTDLIAFLGDQFGIEYKSDRSLGVALNKSEEMLLSSKLLLQKKNNLKAENDSKLILTIYAIREKNNELGEGILGYRTWWLSTDRVTQRTVNEVFGDKYRISCYIRPDFLYNYISLAPSKNQVDVAYQELFPSLIGVNISAHLPKEVSDAIRASINEHKTKSPSRLKGALRELAEKIKTDPNYRNRQTVTHYLDEQLKSYQQA